MNHIEMEWQPVETCPENIAVIVYAPNGKNQTKGLVTQCFHFLGDNFSTGYYSNRIVGVTHWMHLPVAPQEVCNDERACSACYSGQGECKLKEKP